MKRSGLFCRSNKLEIFLSGREGSRHWVCIKWDRYGADGRRVLMFGVGKTIREAYCDYCRRLDLLS